MTTNRAMSGIFQVCEAITRMAYLNLLWILFTLLGGVIFGIFPATVALFTVIRKWLLGYSDVPTFKTYWQAYKKNFFSAQVIGIGLIVISFILYIDYRYFFSQSGLAVIPVKVLTGSAVFVFAMVVLYIFPVYVHYKLSLFQYFKNALFIGLSHFIHSIVMVISTGILFYIFLKFSGLLLIFGISVFAYWVTWIALIVFKRLDTIKNNQPENN